MSHQNAKLIFLEYNRYIRNVIDIRMETKYSKEKQRTSSTIRIQCDSTESTRQVKRFFAIFDQHLSSFT